MTIRNRILIFSVLVTLVPSFGMGWFLNNTIHATITEKTEQQLLDSSNIITREISLWFKERNYDLHVFSSSFVILENFIKYLKAEDSAEKKSSKSSVAARKIETYLSSVEKQFDNYTRLSVLDTEGAVIAASVTEDKAHPVHLPKNTAEQIAATTFFRGDIYFEKGTNSPLILLGIPLFSDQYDKHIGYLAIEARLQAILPLLNTGQANTNTDVYVSSALIDLKNGLRFLSNDNSMAPVTVSKDVLQLFNNPSHLHDFSNHRSERVVGIATPLQQLHWGLVVTVDHDAVFMKVTRSRDRNILIVCSLMLIIGFVAYLFARQIITPLATLTKGALQVADGNLDVHLPVRQNDELGFATRVFNGMVAELQRSHTQLEQLATTDSLTGIANRKLILETLVKQFDYYQRYGTEFSILMIDIDYFKKTNDTYGHQAGDTVLRQLGAIFPEILRNVDTAGRYGGEEFLVILVKTGGEKAQHTAERIRHTVQQHQFTFGSNQLQVTISIGVAKILEDDTNEGNLISRADQALYQAKANGRNQVVYMVNNSSAVTQSKKIFSLPRSVQK